MTIITAIIVILVLILIIMIIGLAVFFYFKNKIESFSSSIFGAKNFFEGINSQKEEFEAEPKTPFGMDNLVLPEIIKDFPYMHIEQMKTTAEESIQSYFKSIELKEIQHFLNPSEKLINNLHETIKQYNKDSLKIENVNIHKTVINKYEKNGSICTLVFQTSLGYNLVKNGNPKKTEDRVNTEFIYIYDDNKIKGNESISLHCPSCGAPIKGLGHKVCPYCTAGLIDIAPKTWKLNDIERLKT